MRAVELAKVAASAESLRLRTMAQRQATRGVYGAIAGIFALGVLILLHVVAFELMVPHVTPLVASLILLAFDLIVAAICGYLALSSKPSAVEEEAHAIRAQALIEMRGSVTMMALAGEAAGLVFRRRRSVTLVKPRGTVGLAAELAARLLSRR